MQKKTKKKRSLVFFKLERSVAVGMATVHLPLPPSFTFPLRAVAGQIVGGVVGALAVIALIATAVYFVKVRGVRLPLPLPTTTAAAARDTVDVVSGRSGCEAKPELIQQEAE